MLDLHIFREYDIRGDVRSQLTREVAECIGRSLAISHFNPGANLVVGRDARTHSPGIQQKLIHGLNIEGVNVIDLGQITTPMMYYALFKHHPDGGVMVTGSHNPINDNGLKICRGTESFVRSDIETVRDITIRKIESLGAVQESQDAKGQTKSLSIAQDYEDEILSRVKPNKKLKIVIDAGNGVAGPFAKSLFAHYASELTCLYCDPDGTFPHHHPDPSVAKNLVDLQNAVLDKGADLGLAFDGDGDRLGVVDNKGQIVPADHLIILFAREILNRRHGETILGDVKCSKQTFDDIRAHGGNAVMTKTGHALIKAKIRETKAALAGEMSGHFFFGDRWFGFDDALYAGARMIEIAANAVHQRLSVSDLLADLPQTHATPELRIDCPDDIKFGLASEMYKIYSKIYPTSDLDGARIDFPNGWALIRASNTQPVIVIRVEADSIESGNSILADLNLHIQQYANAHNTMLDLNILRMGDQ